MKFIDLFAGIGGMRIPFDELGHECVFTSEWDKFAQKTYEANFGDKPHGDITKIKAWDIPSHDLLLAGFPCQSFSNAGLKKGFADIRGTMFFHIARILEHHKPAYFLLENVKGLVHHDKGRTFETMKNLLIILGYNIQYKILNAKDFGLPQNRQRVFILGSYLKIPTNLLENMETLESTRVGDILEDYVPPKYTKSDKGMAGLIRRKERHKGAGRGFGYTVVCAKNAHTNTLTARYGNDGSEILIDQGEMNPRRLTPRECARLQGFPDSFKIVCSDRQAYKQFGNALPVNVVRSIAKMINNLCL